MSISGFQFNSLPLMDAYEITMSVSLDQRGSFQKIYEEVQFTQHGIEFKTSEIFYSISVLNVIRGLHFQTIAPQAKLVSVLSGCIYDVIVDIRYGSRDFGKWVGVYLSADNHKMVYVPRGFAHGFLSLIDNSVVCYQCDGRYSKQSDNGIRYDDPTLNINWPLAGSIPTISERDLSFQNFMEYCYAK